MKIFELFATETISFEEGMVSFGGQISRFEIEPRNLVIKHFSVPSEKKNSENDRPHPKTNLKRLTIEGFGGHSSHHSPSDFGDDGQTSESEQRFHDFPFEKEFGALNRT